MSAIDHLMYYDYDSYYEDIVVICNGPPNELFKLNKAVIKVKVKEGPQIIIFVVFKFTLTGQYMSIPIPDT